MTTNVQINTELWEKFTVLAAQRRKRPNRLLEKLVAEYLLIEKDLQLDEMIGQHARRTAYKESDAVELVKRYRQKKRPK